MRALTHMNEKVITLVVADHQIRVRVIFIVAINMMNNRPFRQPASKYRLSDQNVLVLLHAVRRYFYARNSYGPRTAAATNTS